MRFNWKGWKSSVLEPRERSIIINVFGLLVDRVADGSISRSVIFEDLTLKRGILPRLPSDKIRIASVINRCKLFWRRLPVWGGGAVRMCEGVQTDNACEMKIVLLLLLGSRRTRGIYKPTRWDPRRGRGNWPKVGVFSLLSLEQPAARYFELSCRSLKSLFHWSVPVSNVSLSRIFLFKKYPSVCAG